VKISVLKSEILLISLAIFCQCFSYADWYFIKTIFNVVDAEHAHLVLDDFSPFWFFIYFVGKLMGTYCFGKMTQSLNYFKIMRFISFIYLAAVFLILIVLVRGQDFYSSYQTLYCTCFLTSLPFYALTILSAMYLFERHPPSQHSLIGSSIVFAIFSSCILFRLLMNAVPHEYINYACIFTALITCLSFFIYAYVEKHSVQSATIPIAVQKLSFSFVQKLNCAFIGTGWNLGFSYYYYSLAPYMKNIYVIDHYTIGGTSICFIAQLLGLIPAIAICKKLGALKTLKTSLVCTLVLGTLMPFMGLTKESYLLLQCVLGFFSACGFAPILMLLYTYYQNTKNLFVTIFWFAVGATISTLIFSLVSHFTKSLNFKFGGMFVFIVCVLLSLIGANATQPQKITDVCAAIAA
jgi:hypothetical protein